MPKRMLGGSFCRAKAQMHARWSIVELANFRLNCAFSYDSSVFRTNPARFFPHS